MNRRDEGYRYIREYRTKDGSRRWALWQTVNGKRTRVGTAKTEEERTRFLCP